MKTAVKLFAAVLLLASALSALAEVHYVDVNSTNSTPPYLSWATAATNIQDAVDTAVSGDEITVTNGNYATGGREGNRVTVDKPLNIRSINGPQSATIDGGFSVRCVYLTNEATLSGFTLTNGFARYGGGIYCQSTTAMVSNCVLSGNVAKGDRGAGAAGGAVYGGTLNYCTLTGNSAEALPGYDIFGRFPLGFYAGDASGGGAANCTLNDCTLIGNSARAPFNYASFYAGKYGGKASGGGAVGCALNNCTVMGNVAQTPFNSVINGSGNWPLPWVPGAYGGGAYGCTLTNCTLTNNEAPGYGGTIHIGNFGYVSLFVAGNGGGALDSMLDNCSVSGNSASYNAGGGAYHCRLNNCTLTGNDYDGALSSTLNNCAVTGNSIWGAGDCTLTNCTLTGNGGGAYGSTLNNCIVYFNGGNWSSADNTLNYCCTTPLSTNGVGNISSDPQLANAWRLSAGSPCRGAGNAAYASGTDVDGEAWASPPSIGCDEYHAGTLTGPLHVAITASLTNVLVGYAVDLTALIEGRASANSWNFGDGTTATNLPYTSHVWTALGDYAVVLRAYNESQPGGISATVIVHVVNGVHYVAADSANPVAPYTSWATAATNIQDAINAAEPGGPVLVRVTNGIYAPIYAPALLTVESVNGPQATVINGGGTWRCVGLADGAILSGFTLTNGYVFNGNGGGAYGGALTNCTLIGNHGSSGGGAFQSALNNCTLANNTSSTGGGAFNSTLNHCTLIGNSAQYDGGGAAYCTIRDCALGSNSASFGQGGGAAECTLDNCTLIGNSAHGYQGSGGGAFGCTLTNCMLTGNSASFPGGGAATCTLCNCTLTGNIVSDPIYEAIGGGAAYCTLHNSTLTGNAAIGGTAKGGGVFSCTLNNCIAYFNAAADGANYDFSSSLNYSCTTPLPTNGVGNITNAPLFVDQGSGNLRLQSNSPCINGGLNAFAPAGPDLDGNPRIVGATVDIGAYEFQSLSVIGFGVGSNRFGFNVTGQSNWVIVLEVSSDLTNWTALTTNTLSGRPLPFRDLAPPNLPQRFYRARFR